MRHLTAPSSAISVAFLILLCCMTGRVAASATDEPYLFEMIVFERPVDRGAELWPEEPGLPDRERARSELGSTVPRSARELGPVAYSLGRRGMTVHAHLIWQQVPGSRNGEDWRWLDAGRLQGLVRISRGRFLHLDTDMLLSDPASATVYRVRLNRRMRSNELHYVDHPKVGIVIRAKRVEPDPEAAPGTDDQGEPKPVEPAATPSAAGQS